MDKIRDKLIELQNMQETQAVEYEKGESYEMAYLSRWYILEKMLKILDTKLKADELHNKIRKWWEEYLSNPASNQLEQLKSLQLKEASNIPSAHRIKEIEKCFNMKLSAIKEIMHTKSGSTSTKWRKRRNDVAHGATPFREKERYEEFRKKIMEGISEIEEALLSKGSDQLSLAEAADSKGKLSK